MDTLNKNHLKQAIIKVLEDYLIFLGNDPECDIKLIIDEKKDHYLVVEIGWHNNHRIYLDTNHNDYSIIEINYTF